MTPNVRDLILGCFLLGLGVALQVYIIPEGVVVPRSVKSIALSPDLWPRVVAGLFILLGGIILAQLFVRHGREREGDGSGSKEGEDRTIARSFGGTYVAGAAISLFAYYGLIRFLGIPVASALAILLFCLLYGERRYPIIIAIAVIVPTTLYLFFEIVARVPIPMGIFAI